MTRICTIHLLREKSRIRAEETQPECGRNSALVLGKYSHVAIMVEKNSHKAYEICTALGSFGNQLIERILFLLRWSGCQSHDLLPLIARPGNQSQPLPPLLTRSGYKLKICTLLFASQAINQEL
jgi:hypothetical protein